MTFSAFYQFQPAEGWFLLDVPLPRELTHSQLMARIADVLIPRIDGQWCWRWRDNNARAATMELAYQTSQSHTTATLILNGSVPDWYA